MVGVFLWQIFHCSLMASEDKVTTGVFIQKFSGQDFRWQFFSYLSAKLRLAFLRYLDNTCYSEPGL